MQEKCVGWCWMFTSIKHYLPLYDYIYLNKVFNLNSAVYSEGCCLKSCWTSQSYQVATSCKESMLSPVSKPMFFDPCPFQMSKFDGSSSVSGQQQKWFGHVQPAASLHFAPLDYATRRSNQGHEGAWTDSIQVDRTTTSGESVQQFSRRGLQYLALTMAQLFTRVNQFPGFWMRSIKQTTRQPDSATLHVAVVEPSLSVLGKSSSV